MIDKDSATFKTKSSFSIFMVPTRYVSKLCRKCMSIYVTHSADC